MNYSSAWEQYYKETPLNKIPWNRTQANYFTKIIESGKVNPGSALDLGCGMGMMSIYLAKKGFKSVGIDISRTAIKVAKENAKKAKVKVKFMIADVANLNCLKDKKFDFVLDWANLHGIHSIKRKKYIAEIVKHTKKDSKLLLRCFSKIGTKKEFVVRPMGFIYLFSRKEIKELFGKYFKILEINRSEVLSRKTTPSKYFEEYLMERL